MVDDPTPDPVLTLLKTIRSQLDDVMDLVKEEREREAANDG